MVAHFERGASEKGTYEPYPVDLIGELEDLLHKRISHDPAETETERLQRDQHIQQILTELSTYRPPRVGDVVAGAELLSVIDSGNFGTVWRGRLTADGSACAVKVFSHEGLGKGRMTREFRQGVGAMRALTNANPPETIVRLLDHDPAQLAFSMTLVEGTDLRQLEQRGWTLKKKLEVFQDLCGAVKFAHTHKVIHRDLKPANVLIGKTGRAVLTDFDLADLLTIKTLTARSPGSLAYAAPEQLEPSGEADQAARLLESDIYSLGRILFYLVVGSTPSGVFRQAVPELPELEEHDGLRRIVRRCTLKSPARRYGSVDELLSDLARRDAQSELVGCDLPGDAPTHELQEVPPQAVGATKQKRRRRLHKHPAVVGATIGALAVVLAPFVPILFNRSSNEGQTPTSKPANAPRPPSLASAPLGAHSTEAPSSSAASTAMQAASCPDACCAGTPCEDKVSCADRVRCQICRDRSATWSLSLRHLTLNPPGAWSDLKVCISMGNQCQEQCVLTKDIGTPFARFECNYSTNDFRGGFLKVLGKNQASVEQRIAQGKFSFRVGAEAACQGLKVPKLEDRNGHVESISLTVEPNMAQR